MTGPPPVRAALAAALALLAPSGTPPGRAALVHPPPAPHAGSLAPARSFAGFAAALSGTLPAAPDGLLAGGPVLSDPASAAQANARVALVTAGPPGARFSPAWYSGGTDLSRAHRCLAEAIFYEAGAEPAPGRRAVAQVVLNRVADPLFPKSVCGVVYQRSAATCQFTFACDGSLARTAAGPAWRAAQDEAAAALAGRREDGVGMATHYHADYVFPPWALQLGKVAVIGRHIFYRWPGVWLRRTDANSALLARAPLHEPDIDRAGLIAQALARIAMRQGARTDRQPAPGPAGNPLADDSLGPAPPRAPQDGGFLDPASGWRPASF